MFNRIMAAFSSTYQKILLQAFQKREALFNDPENTAYRLFNGFCEGLNELTIDRYGDTCVIQWMSKKSGPDRSNLMETASLCLETVPGIRTILFKNRYSRIEAEKKGILLEGSEAEHVIREWGISYPVRLQVNKDCGFYLDTALLRKWLLENSAGKRVFNTFAYTGSLGDAAEAGGARSVTQTDLNRNYLSARKETQEYLFGDFFHVTAALRRSNRLFDIILLDPPFFAGTARSAKVDQARNASGPVNKIRPLAAHNGKIIVINNALFLSGQDFLDQIGSLCGDCLSIAGIIPVPDSFFGYDPIGSRSLPADPAPFNHPTKILILDVLRKDERS